ncbi:hypothetical protein BZM27_31075 [Paraburkholderia steynii]|uniref:Uncharacterized protein n=1 Tax=Paraburkholderia steynii TaxID=1245441 RepID=A0A4R0X9W5_9BURK|nr:hypothetical protein BZM27_31075 [Paraburkholderia steynii]
MASVRSIWGVALVDAGLVEVIERQSLLQGKDVFGLVVPYQSGPDGLDAGPTIAITHGRQYAGITLTTHDGADDPHSRGARHIADDVVQLKVHEGQRLLHMLDMRRRVVKMSFPKPQIGAKRSDVATGLKLGRNRPQA